MPLLVLAGLPLVLLHLGLLIERALHLESMDGVVAARWAMSIVLLAALKRAGPQLRSLQSPTLGIAAILVIALIHAPVAAPEPALPLAATGLGLALSLAVVDRRRTALLAGSLTELLGRPSPPARRSCISREMLKDRAPPALR